MLVHSGLGRLYYNVKTWADNFCSVVGGHITD